MVESITQYDLMSTSTCTPLGGGSTRCTYQYTKEVSTTTETGILEVRSQPIIEIGIAVFIFFLVFWTSAYFVGRLSK